MSEKEYPKKRQDKYTAVRIPKGQNDELDAFLKTDMAKKLGYNYKVEVISQAVREFLEAHQFIHINTYVDRHDIYDLSQKKLISIYFKPDGTAWCQLDESLNCKHVDFALESPSQAA